MSAGELFNDVESIAPKLKSNEWYTQSRYIEAAREVMGGIDLDPASCAVANETVKATQYYTIEDNGLAHSWHGRVWLNPPYGRSVNQIARGQSTIKLFTEKLVREYEAGMIEQAILLATTEINAQWFQPFFNYTICFPDHRVRFNVPEKLNKYSQMFGTSFVYLGPDPAKFADVFSQFGRVLKAIDPPKSKTVPLQLWGLLDAEKKSEQQAQASA